MKRRLFIAAMLGTAWLGAVAQGAIHVSVSGSDTAAGTAEAPFATIEKAIEAVQPGGTIYVHAGTYYPASRILVPEKATSESARIRLMAYGQDEVIVDGSKMDPKLSLIHI